MGGQQKNPGEEAYPMCVHVCVLVTQSCLTLCDSMDCSLPGSSVHGIFQARILEWVAISFSRGSSRPRDQTQVFCIAGRFFTIRTTGKPNPMWRMGILPAATSRLPKSPQGETNRIGTCLELLQPEKLGRQKVQLYHWKK